MAITHVQHKYTLSRCSYYIGRDIIDHKDFDVSAAFCYLYQ